MDEVVKMVVERTGLPDDKARIAVEVVVNYLKGKMPGAVAGQIDAAVSGGEGGLSGMVSKLGGI